MNKLKPSEYKLFQRLKNNLNNIHNHLIDRIYCYDSQNFVEDQVRYYNIMVITKKKINWKYESLLYNDIFKYGIEKKLTIEVYFFSSDEVDKIYKQMPFIKNVLNIGVLIN